MPFREDLLGGLVEAILGIENVFWGEDVLTSVVEDVFGRESGLILEVEDIFGREIELSEVNLAGVAWVEEGEAEDESERERENDREREREREAISGREFALMLGVGYQSVQ